MIKLLLSGLILLHFQSSNKRILTIYTRNVSDTYYQQQLKLLKQDAKGLAERDMVIETYVYSEQTAARFKKHRITKNFTLTLTGKDGGEKLREIKPITLTKLFATVDAMPMRQQEMKP